jgi:hypothetical protein
MSPAKLFSRFILMIPTLGAIALGVSAYCSCAFACYEGGITTVTEQEIIDVAPEFMQIFKNVADPVKARAMNDSFLEVINSPRSSARENQITYYSRLLDPNANFGDDRVKADILVAMAQIIPFDSGVVQHLCSIERVGIFSYTTEDYRFINPLLRDQSPSSSAIKYRNALNAVLDKLPAYHGTVKRGLKLTSDELARYTVGFETTFPSFTSTTSDLSLTRFENIHRMIIHSETGRDMSTISANPHEKEVLFKAGSRFKVLRRSQNVELNGSTASEEIELQEVNASDVQH